MPFTDEQKTELAKLISDGLTEVIGGTDFTKQLASTIKSQVGGAVKGLKIEDTVTSAVTAAVTAAMDTGDGGDDDDDKDKGKGKGGMDAKTKARFDAMERKLKEETSARETAETARKTERLLNKARTELGKAGVPADRIPHALALLHHQGGRLVFNDDDVAGIKFTRDGYEEVLSMEKGAKEWVGTDDGKHFLPASKVAGDGSGGGKKAGDFKTTGGKIDRDKVGRALGQLMITGGGRAAGTE